MIKYTKDLEKAKKELINTYGIPDFDTNIERGHELVVQDKTGKNYAIRITDSNNGQYIIEFTEV